jgi:hypothetical protein
MILYFLVSVLDEQDLMIIVGMIPSICAVPGHHRVEQTSADELVKLRLFEAA